MRIAKFVAIVSAATITIFANVEPAAAEACTGPYPNQGIESKSFGAGDEDFAWYVDNSGPSGSSKWHVKLSVGTNGNGVCLNSWFDWQRASGNHYDWRLVRNCAHNAYRGTGAFPAGVSGYSDYIDEQDYAGLSGLHRAAACKSPALDFAEGNMTDCSQLAANASNCNVGLNHDDLPNGATRAWVRKAGGSTDYFSGGNPYLEES